MSTGPTTRAASIPEKQRAPEQDVSHSALFYLLQEVSRLASPIHTNSSKTWLNETCRQEGFVTEMQEVEEKNPRSETETVVEQHCGTKSPWNVLSLINLQCERLLEESDPKSPSSVTNMLHVTTLTLDCNANIVLSPCDSQLSPPSTTERDRSLPEADNKSTRPHDSLDEGSLQTELSSVPREDLTPPASRQRRTKTPRKQPHPSRSVDMKDLDIQGVTFRMGSELDDSREQCRLLITSKYSKELLKSLRKPRPRTRTSHKSLKASSLDEESDQMVSKDKVCASCRTRKTPMWRDAEDGTPLCNACGIRFKKYRVRCVSCWHIPRKEGKSNSCCLRCGNSVRSTSAPRKHST